MVREFQGWTAKRKAELPLQSVRGETKLVDGDGLRPERSVAPTWLISTTPWAAALAVCSRWVPSLAGVDAEFGSLLTTGYNRARAIDVFRHDIRPHSYR
jgi:hypothetical protein